MSAARDFKLMTQQHQDILTKKIETIAGRLCSIQEVLNRLLAEKLITVVESQELMNLPTKSEKGTQLVHLLLRKDDKAFEVFHDVLVETHQTPLADAIYKGFETPPVTGDKPVGVITPQTTSQTTSKSRRIPIPIARPTFRRQSQGRIGDSGNGRVWTDADGDKLTASFLCSAREVKKCARDGLLSDSNISEITHFCTKMPAWIHPQADHRASVDLFMDASKKIEGCEEHLTPLCASQITATCQTTEEIVRSRSWLSLPDLRDPVRVFRGYMSYSSEIAHCAEKGWLSTYQCDQVMDTSTNLRDHVSLHRSRPLVDVTEMGDLKRKNTRKYHPYDVPMDHHRQQSFGTDFPPAAVLGEATHTIIEAGPSGEYNNESSQESSAHPLDLSLQHKDVSEEDKSDVTFGLGDGSEHY